MDVEFPELTKDEQEIVLFLDTCDGFDPYLRDIQKNCPVDNAESVLRGLIKMKIAKRYRAWHRGHKVSDPMYFLTGKGKEAVEWI